MENGVLVGKYIAEIRCRMGYHTFEKKDGILRKKPEG